MEGGAQSLGFRRWYHSRNQWTRGQENIEKADNESTFGPFECEVLWDFQIRQGASWIWAGKRALGWRSHQPVALGVDEGPGRGAEHKWKSPWNRTLSGSRGRARGRWRGKES